MADKPKKKKIKSKQGITLSASKEDRRPASSLDVDKTYIKYLSVVKNCTLDIPALYEELNNIHKSRPMRTATTPGPTKAAKYSMQETAHRSRLVEMRQLAAYEFSVLDIGHGAIQDHITTVHPDEVSGRTVDDRNRAMRRLLAKGERRLKELEAVIEAIDYVIEDIDKAGFSLHRTIEALAITNKGEHT